MKQPSSRNELIEQLNAARADAFRAYSAIGGFVDAMEEIKAGCPKTAHLVYTRPQYQKMLDVLGREVRQPDPLPPEPEDVVSLQSVYGKVPL